jgi:hypothetical protein
MGTHDRQKGGVSRCKTMGEIVADKFVYCVFLYIFVAIVRNELLWQALTLLFHKPI